MSMETQSILQGIEKNKPNFSNTTDAIQINSEEICIFKINGMFKLNLRKGYQSIISTNDWGHIQASSYYRNRIIGFGEKGVFSVDPQQGLFYQISKKQWQDVSAILTMQDKAYLTNPEGLYEVSLLNPNKYELIFQINLKNVRVLVSYNNLIYLIINECLLKLDPVSKQYESIRQYKFGKQQNQGSGINFGKDLYVHFDKVYHIDLETGNYSIIDSSSWDQTYKLFPASKSLKLNFEMPISKGEWILVYKIINPKTIFDETLLLTEGVSFIGISQDDESSIKQSFKKALKHASNNGLLDIKSSQEFGFTFLDYFQRQVEDGFKYSNQFNEELQIQPGKSVFVWQYIFKGQRQYESCIYKTNIIVKTNYGKPSNE